MSEAWRIDTLHPRGGMAFAGLRDEDSQLGSEDASLDEIGVTLEKPAVFITPPGFEPEAVPNRVLGLSAGKGSFQVGLYSAKGEIGFASLEDLIEFVRRVYVASGGGDGFNDGGFQGPPAPQEGPSMPPAEPDSLVEKSDLFKEVSKAIEKFASLSGDKSNKGSRESGKEMQWASLNNLAATEEDSFGQVLLGRGARLLLIELLNRTPRNREGVAPWYEAFSSLCEVIGRSGLWNVYTQLGCSLDIVRRVSKLGVRVADLRYHGYFRANPAPSASDRFEDLIRWPLPKLDIRIPENFEEDGRREPSVFDLMCAFFANPDRIWLCSGRKGDVLAILIFAAAHLTGKDGFSLFFGDSFDGETQLSYAMSNSRTNRALEWITEQLPKRAFSGFIESMIEQAARLRYGKHSVSD